MEVEFHHTLTGIGIACIVGAIYFAYAAFPTMPLLDEGKLVALHSDLIVCSFVFLYGAALVLAAIVVRLRARLCLLEKQISHKGGESCEG